MPDEKAEIHNPESQPNQGQGSAPDSNKVVAAGQVVVPVPGQAVKSDGGVPEGAKVEFFKLREKLRESKVSRESLESSNKALEARLAALEAAGHRTSSENVVTEKVSPFDDPEKWAQSVRAEAVADARASLQQDQAQQKLMADAVKAGEWLRSRSHVSQDPRLAQEVAIKIETTYAAAADVNPAAAARAAYLEVCEEKGIEPDLGRNRPDPNAVTNPRLSAAGGGGGRGEVSLDDMRAMSPAERKEAVGNGRYKGKVIKL